MQVRVTIVASGNTGDPGILQLSEVRLPNAPKVSECPARNMSQHPQENMLHQVLL